MTFIKGQSGNPSGRPKSEINLGALAREYTQQAFDIFVNLLSSNDEAIRMKAAEYLHNRGHGKCKEAVELTGADGGPLSVLAAVIDKPPDETREQWESRIKAKLGI